MEVNDILDWAEGVMSDLGTEHAEKITPLELRLANAIVEEHRRYREEENKYVKTMESLSSM